MTYIPENPNSYTGNQVIINSDRLLFNAKEDSILFYSNKAIGFSTNGNFHFDTSPNLDNKFIINSPNIYLGLEYDNTLPTQSAVLSDDLISSLSDILDLIETLYSDIATNISFLSTTAGTLTGINPKNFQLLRKRTKEIEDIKEELQDIKSEKIKLV
tara:strand:- start:874 stop:1344 length:471 start_codon:yes stop_codon:yes gene_type:complete